MQSLNPDDRARMGAYHLTDMVELLPELAAMSNGPKGPVADAEIDQWENVGLRLILVASRMLREYPAMAAIPSPPLRLSDGGGGLLENMVAVGRRMMARVEDAKARQGGPNDADLSA